MKGRELTKNVAAVLQLDDVIGAEGTSVRRRKVIVDWLAAPVAGRVLVAAARFVCLLVLSPCS